MRVLWNLITLLIGFVWVSGHADAGAIKVFEQTAGDWKATCYREVDEAKPYCRIMVIKIIGDGQARNFAQFGPAWDGDNTGVVVATYLGFARESLVSLQVDDNEPWSVRAPDDNHLITAPDLTEVVLKAMQTGGQITLKLRPASGIPTTFEVALAPYRELYVQVQAVLKNANPEK